MFRKPNDTKIAKIVEIFEQSKYLTLLKACENGDSKEGIINIYHREETVLDHIKMVYDYVYEHFNQHSEFKVLLIGALLHDIGKIKTRVVNKEKNRVRFIGHEMTGIWDALEFLKSIDSSLLSDDAKEKILKIIAFHNIYKYTPEVNAQRFNLTDLMLLYTFHEADSKGRILDDKKTEYLPESLIKKSTKPIIDDQNKEVIFMMGIPGSGKSTYTSKLLNNRSVYICRDDILLEYGMKKYEKTHATYSEIFKLLTSEDHKMIDKLFYKKIKDSVKLTEFKIIIDKTNTSVKSRNTIFNNIPSLKDEKIYKKCIVMLPTLSEIKKRLKLRSIREGKDISNDVIDKFIRSFHLPDLREFDEIKYILH